jgi:hypothetical protein
MYRTSLPRDPLHLIALNRDVFFGVRLRNLAKELGYDLVLAPTAAAVGAALATHHQTTALVIIDMNVLREAVDWEQLAAILADYPAIPSLGFGSYTDVETRRAAKAAGLTRIVANSEFHRDAAALIQRYALVDEEDSGAES